MARRRDRDPREADAVLSQPLAQLLSPAPVRPRPIVTYKPPNLRDVEDRRTYHPLERNRPAKTFSGHPVQPHKIKPSKFKTQLPFGLNFAVPKETVVCVRRKQRREVLFAKKKYGRGAGRRKPRKNFLSTIGC